MKSDNQTGDDLDFHSIYKTFHPKIVRYLAHMVGWRNAEDLTQNERHSESSIPIEHMAWSKQRD